MPALPTREHAPRRVRRAESGTGHTGDEPGQSSASHTNASSPTPESATVSPSSSSSLASSVLSAAPTTTSHSPPVKNVANAVAASPRTSSFSSPIPSSSSSPADTPSSSSSQQSSVTPSSTSISTATSTPSKFASASPSTKAQSSPTALSEPQDASDAPAKEKPAPGTSPAATPSPTGSASSKGSNNSGNSQGGDEEARNGQPSSSVPSSTTGTGTPTPHVKAADQASSDDVPSVTVINVPSTIPISVTTTRPDGQTTVSVSFTTSSAAVTSTLPPLPTVANVQAAATTSTAKTKIIAGVVGGLGGAILLAALAFFLCMRRRRRAATKFESVRPSMFFRPCTPATPRTPKSPKTPRSIAKSETSQYVHDLGPLSPTSSSGHSHSGHGTPRRTNNISPKLIVQVHAPPVVGSAHSYYLDPEESAHDPFADPLAVARARPRVRLSAQSPTIRVSDATLVGESRVPPGESGLKHSVTAESADEKAGEQLAPPPQDLEMPSAAFLTPPPALSPLAGKTNRLSDQSLASPPSPESSDNHHGYAM